MPQALSCSRSGSTGFRVDPRGSSSCALAGLIATLSQTTETTSTIQGRSLLLNYKLPHSWADEFARS